MRGTYLDEEDVARLLKLSLPGIDEVIGLLEIVRMAARAPAIRSITSSSIPRRRGTRCGCWRRRRCSAASPACSTHLQSHHRAVVSALRGSYRGDAADALIVELERDGEALAAMLRDPAASDVTWVTLPEPMALEETSDALASLRRRRDSRRAG